MTLPFTNGAYSTVAVSPGLAGTALSLSAGDGSLFPNPALVGSYPLSVWPSGQVYRSDNGEIVTVTAKSGDSLTISRGAESSTPRTILVGDQIAMAPTAATLNNLKASTATVNDGTGVIPPASLYAGISGPVGGYGWTQAGIRKLGVIEGSIATPIGDGTTPPQPSVTIFRTVNTGLSNVHVEGGALNVNVYSVAPTGIVTTSNAQANGIQSFIDQLASTDAMPFGSQVVMQGVGGRAYGYYGNLTMTPHTFTVNTGTDTLTFATEHGLYVNHEIQVASRVAITAVSTAANTEITTAVNHGLSVGDYVYIEGCYRSNPPPVYSTANVNGTYVVLTVSAANKFTIGVNVTVPPLIFGTVTSRTLPAGLARDTRYFVKTVPNATTMTLATTPGGTTVDITSAGAGTFYATGVGLNVLNPLTINGSFVDFTYGASGGDHFMANILLQTLANTGLAGAGIWFFPDGTLMEWSEGVIFGAGTIRNTSILDLSSSGTSILIGGSHSIGIDFSFGSFTDYLKYPAWTAVSGLTINSSGGSITTASATCRYLRDGKRITIQLVGSITTNGTGSGVVQIVLPNSWTAAAAFVLTGRENNVTGKMLMGYLASGTGVIWIQYYDGTYPGANGVSLAIDGVIEVN